MGNTWLTGAKLRESGFAEIHWPGKREPGAVLFGRITGFEDINVDGNDVRVIVFGPSLVADSASDAPRRVVGARVLSGKLLEDLIPEHTTGAVLVLTYHGIPAGKRYKVFTVAEQSTEALAEALAAVPVPDDDELPF